MKRIFITGATGVMGSHGLKALLSSPERYEITVLARDSKKNRRCLRPFVKSGVKVIWGDMLDRVAVARGVADADIVLHVGGMVSPAADWFPEKTIHTNVESTRIIIEAALPRKDSVKVVYIGSVSQYGAHHFPYHWGKCGDPLKATPFDAYAFSKIESERLLMESGLRWWVSLRQTGILHSGLLMKANDPIMFHVPLQGVLEWVSAEDAGALLERVCRSSVPDSFWCNCYNVGGGADYRLTNYEFECLILEAMGCPPPEKIFRPNWFATDNFHGLWFEDSDRLEQLLHFRSGIPIREYFRMMKKELPWYFSLAPLAPAFAIRAFMKKVASTPKLGPLWWIKNNVADRINAAWGSFADWKKIPGWESFSPLHPDRSTPLSSPAKSECHSDIDNDVLKIYRCDRCGREYSLRPLTFYFGHRCPNCTREITINS